MNPLRRHSRVLAPFYVALALASLLGGSFEIHQDHEDLVHDLRSGGSYLDTCGQTSTTHFEAAHVRQRPDCSACLYRLQVSGADSTVTAATFEVTAGPERTVELTPARLVRRLDPRTSRGPPAV
ncbi:MAG: hypothetical protein KDD11_06900 [Acidobacteria bacterium]|nr:hypothetical protein [Acidobacteriota bacterium]